LIFYLVLTLIIVILTSVGHVFLKIGAIRALESEKSVYFDILSIFGYAIFALVAFLSIYAMKGIALKVFFALNSLTYICIPLLAYFVLKEPETQNRIIGIVVISAGVIIFNL
jgi:small multidrug resistance pump